MFTKSQIGYVQNDQQQHLIYNTYNMFILKANYHQNTTADGAEVNYE